MKIDDTMNFLASSDETSTFYSTYMILFLLVGDINGARFLWKRISNSIKESNSDLVSLWSIGALLWEQNFHGLQKLFNVTWSTSLQPLVHELKSRLQVRQMELYEQSYSMISLANVSESLMTDIEETKQCKFCTSM